ncbi:hypothetical protein V6N12_038709 [Hibiscus sabdariffa]|uniref:Uncharacterized protein n=1 Tax=Hibiscus sabdariffa TaxID=183260 RepID=A0ABR2CAL5_9ROSI
MFPHVPLQPGSLGSLCHWVHLIINSKMVLYLHSSYVCDTLLPIRSSPLHPLLAAPGSNLLPLQTPSPSPASLS